METVLLLKAVLPLEEMAWDPVRRTAIRPEGRLRPNPFDLRALGAALAVRRPGETVTVLSVGPEAALPALAEALRAGADRSIRIGDPALAGSDLLITARVLARALGRLPADLILAGRTATDSGSGAVAAELAGLLDRPLLGPAGSLRRGSGDGGVEITVEGDPAATPLRVPPGAVVTVGEKVGRPARPDPAADGGRSPESWDLTALGLRPEEVGLAASPTEVREIGPPTPPRLGRRFPAPDPAGGVEAAARAIAAALEAYYARRAGTSGPPTGAAPPSDFLVLGTDAAGELDPTAGEILHGIGRRGSRGTAVVVAAGTPEEDGPGGNPGAGAAGATAAGGLLADASGRAVASVRGAGGPGAAAGAVAGGLREILADMPAAEAVLIPASEFGGQVAGKLAARMGTALVTGAVDAEPSRPTWLWRKPSFGRDRLATVKPRTRPYVVTIRPGAFRTGPSAWPVPSAGGAAVATGRRGGATGPGYGDLDRADLVVVAGTGVGGAAEIARLAAMVPAGSSALAATRRVVDAGLLPPGLQVGLTGRSPEPALAILVGVSGSVHHLSGWLRAGVVAAINPDPEAPVFGRVDVGLVGRWEELLPELLRGIAAARPEGGR